MRQKIWTIPLFIILVFTAQLVHALDPVYSDWRGNAINGYDPVSYFSDDGPLEGKKDLTHDWQGATWRFASEENRQAFASNPDKFAPQYGGYCAWAVSQGYTASTDPLAWNITDGRLYLNYNQSVQTTWLVEKEDNIEKGNANWPGLKQ